MSFVCYFDSSGVREVSVVAALSKSYILGFLAPVRMRICLI